MTYRERFCTYIYLLPIFYTNTNALSILDKSSEILSDLLQDGSKKPLIVLVGEDNAPKIPDFDEVPKERYSLFDDNSAGQVENVVKYEQVKTVQQQAVYLLRNIIKSPDNKHEEPSVIKNKQVLRQALRARCQKVEKCVRKCPPKKPQCPVSCQQTFDDLNLCEEPTTRRPKKCATGRTMPPSWRF